MENWDESPPILSKLAQLLDYSDEHGKGDSDQWTGKEELNSLKS